MEQAFCSTQPTDVRRIAPKHGDSNRPFCHALLLHSSTVLSGTESDGESGASNDKPGTTSRSGGLLQMGAGGVCLRLLVCACVYVCM